MTSEHTHSGEGRARRMGTEAGRVTIHAFCPPDRIGAARFDPSFSSYSRYKPLVTDKTQLMQTASIPDNNVTLACTAGDNIVGLAVLEYPSAAERWARVGDRVMMELAVIEVASAWRSRGLSRVILEAALDHPLKEKRIFFMVGYSWTWDLAWKGVTPIQYREMLIRLFTPFGFRTYQTNEPNVMLRPENLFMARLGAEIPPEVEKRFKWVRFDMDRLLA